MVVHQVEKGRVTWEPDLSLGALGTFSGKNHHCSFPKITICQRVVLKGLFLGQGVPGKFLPRLPIDVVTECLLKTAFHFRTVDNIGSQRISQTFLTILNQPKSTFPCQSQSGFSVLPLENGRIGWQFVLLLRQATIITLLPSNYLKPMYCSPLT